MVEDVRASKLQRGTMDISSPVIERRFQRISTTVPVTLLLDREGTQTECEAYTVDLSQKGIRVRATSMLTPGETVGIAHWSESSQTVMARVVWALPSHLGSLAGLEYPDTLPV